MVNPLYRLTGLLLTIFACGATVAQVPDAFQLPVSGTDSAIGCKGFVQDDGGSGNYGNNKVVRFDIKFPGADSIQLKFDFFDYQLNVDSLVIYTDFVNGANRLGRFTGSIIPFDGKAITVAAQRLILIQYAGPTGIGVGFKLDYESVYNKALSVKISQSDTAVCIGQSMFLSAKASGGRTSGYSYSWSNGLGNNPLASTVLTDTMMVYVSISDGCSVAVPKDSLRLDTYLPLIMGVSNDTTICVGQAIDLLATIYGGNRLHGGGAYLLDWSNGVKAGSIHVFPTVTTMYYVEGSEGCSPNVLDSVLVTVRNPLFLSPVLDTTLCNGSFLTVNLLDSGGYTPSRKIVWDSSSLSGNTVVINPVAVGKTTYRLHVEDGCTVLNDTVSFVVDRLSPLTGGISLSDSILCYGDSTNVLIWSGGGRSSTLNWQLDGVVTGLTTLRDAPLTSKVYSLLVQDGCSISFTDTIGVVVAPAKIQLTLGLHDSVICAGAAYGFLEVNGTGGFAPLTYAWDDPAKQSTAKASGLSKGKYVLRVVDVQGCEDSLGLFVNEYLSPMKPLKDTVIARGSLARLYAPNGQQWRWSPKLFMMSSDTVLRVTVRPMDSIQYSLLALDSNGCLFRDSMWVRVVDPEVVRIPNIITPNGDGDNDVWDLYELFEYNQRKVDIYSRAGELVYSTGAYQNNWTGTNNLGEELPMGVYFYYMKHNVTGEEHRGFVQIMR